MKKTYRLLLVLAAGLVLTGCGGTSATETPTAAPATETPTQTPGTEAPASETFDPTALLATFDKAVSGTVKATYAAKYNVDVNANGGTANMSSFKHQIDATTTIEMNVSADDPYFYAQKVWEDKLVENSSKTIEYLLAKAEDGKYYYQTTTEDPVEVADPAAKVGELFTSVTEEQAGVLSLSTLNYSSDDLNYELVNVGLTDTFVAADLEDNEIAYAANASGGIDVTYKPYYVGYHTDGGWSDFHNETDGYAATVTVNTDNKGNVTKFDEEYHNASLDFAIMTPAPTVSITGSRVLNASYGDELTRKTSVERAIQYGTVTIDATENGTFTTSWFDYANNNFKMNAVASGDQVQYGMYLGIKPTANDGYEVDSVTVNGAAPVATVQGIYCFPVNTATQKVTVTFKAAGAEEETTPSILYTYEGSAANGTVMDINLYDDKTFTITCPGFNGAKAVDGTYTMASGVLTLTSEEGHVNYMGTPVAYEITFTIAADFQTMTTAQFFNGDEITFTYQKASSGEEEKAEATILYTYEGSAANGTVMDINLYSDGTFTITCPGYGGATAVDGTYTKSGSTVTLTSSEGHVNYMGTPVTYEITCTIAADFQTMTTAQFFNGDEITFTYQKA